MYLNDIFIYNNFEKKHRQYIKKMLKRFRTVNFQIDIIKCEFNVIKITYFKFIVTMKIIRINLKKIIIIKN